MKTDKRRFTITFNRSRRTYTIRRYDNGKLAAKYRSYPQGRDFSETWTENDIRNYLHQAVNDYYVILIK